SVHAVSAGFQKSTTAVSAAGSSAASRLATAAWPGWARTTAADSGSARNSLTSPYGVMSCRTVSSRELSVAVGVGASPADSSSGESWAQPAVASAIDAATRRYGARRAGREPARGRRLTRGSVPPRGVVGRRPHRRHGDGDAEGGGVQHHSVARVDADVGDVGADEDDVAGLGVVLAHGGAVLGLGGAGAWHVLADRFDRPLHQTGAVELVGGGGAPDVR